MPVSYTHLDVYKRQGDWLVQSLPVRIDILSKQHYLRHPILDKAFDFPDGVSEVMLLGQNVNSYGKTLDEPITFADVYKRQVSHNSKFRLVELSRSIYFPVV